ncbi:MAG: ATPase [Lachnospiraceae bacterium]|nr:ATPase [Lachnospiraceae bacterium]
MIKKEVFTTLYEKILAEQQRLKKQIHSIEFQLKSFPKGKIICARNDNRYKWYISDGHTSTYLPKKERKLAEQLAAKKYLTLLHDDLIHEIQALEFYIKHHEAYVEKAEHLLLSMSEYQKLLSPFFKPLSKELLEWMNSPYEHNLKYPEQLTLKTISGHTVRSKSEALIDMALHVNKIPFRYECALPLSDIVLYPDFTIRHPQTGNFYYWEHFGMMDDLNYSKQAYSKLQLYTTHGIVPSIQLITTYETKEHPLNSETVDHIIREYFT